MTYDYGLWIIVAGNVLFFAFFVVSFLRPKVKREWRSLGVLSAFLVALFTEMYGFPLSIYILTNLLGRTPFANPFSHMSGNILASLFLGGYWGLLFMGVGGILMFVGLGILGAAWTSIH